MGYEVIDDSPSDSSAEIDETPTDTPTALDDTPTVSRDTPTDKDTNVPVKPGDVTEDHWLTPEDVDELLSHGEWLYQTESAPVKPRLAEVLGGGSGTKMEGCMPGRGYRIG